MSKRFNPDNVFGPDYLSYLLNKFYKDLHSLSLSEYLTLCSLIESRPVGRIYSGYSTHSLYQNKMIDINGHKTFKALWLIFLINSLYFSKLDEQKSLQSDQTL